MTTVTELADETIDILFDQQPLAGTILGLPSTRDGLLTDYTRAGEDRIVARMNELLARARAIDPETLTETDRVTRLVVLSTAEEVLTRLRARLVEFTICDNFNAPANEPLVLMPMITIDNATAAEAYLARLGAIPEALEALADRHRAAIAVGVTPVRPLVDDAAEFIQRYLANEQDPLRRPTPSADSGVDLADFNRRRDDLLRDVVHPAYGKYRDVLLAEVAPHSRDADHPGLSWLTGGEAIYAALIRMHTNTERGADELHQTGLDIISRLEAEYAEVGGRVFGTTDVAEIFERMRTDPALRWNDADEILNAARSAIERAEREAPRWFGRRPSQSCEVRAVPDDEAPGAAPGYYLPPAMDGSRPGIYFANTYQPQERNRYASQALAFHEAVPGHHFQVTIALELGELPLLRRLAASTAYGEGWGLYSERLAAEMGLYSDDVALLGMLAADSHRAARLVVDTGLHAKGWTRAQAVQYMTEHTPVAPVDIESEIDRYIANPGQALAYMVGRLEIQRIRARTEAALGDRFDIRAFHDVVLGTGGLPLDVLDQVVAAWAAGV